METYAKTSVAWCLFLVEFLLPKLHVMGLLHVDKYVKLSSGKFL